MNEREIFQGALEYSDPGQRQAYLEQACGGDAALRARIEALLFSHDSASQFLNVPALEQLNPQNECRPFQTVDFPQSVVAKAAAGDDDIPENEAAAVPDLSFLNPSLKPGSLGMLGHYEILNLLGQGAFGLVFRAFDEKLHRQVAIKVMNPQLAATSPPRKRFLREARSAAAIKHENIVQVYSVEEQPLPYLVMEYVDGQTLKDSLDASGPLEVGEIVHLGRQMAIGLAAAHGQGLIHRDIKPGNILIEAGVEQKVKITDFGLARAADDATMTRTGVISGTPMYMAPEQAQGVALDHRADLFSLGSVLYQMACGRPPFRGPTTIAVLKRVADEAPRPIQEIVSEAPDWLCAIIAKLHAKLPEDRFQSAKEVADLLACCQASLQQNSRVDLPGYLHTFLPMAAGATKDEPQVPKPTPVKPAAQERNQPPHQRRWAAAVAILLVMFAGLSLTEATGVTNVRGTVIRLFSPDGTLVVEVDDPGVSVSIDGEELVITGTGAKEIRLKPGQYKVLASKDGKLLSQELVTVTKNGRQVVRVSKEVKSVVDIGGAPKTSPSSRNKLPPPGLAVAPFDEQEANQHQEQWAKYLGRNVFEENSLGMKLMLIPPGEFTMGNADTAEKVGKDFAGGDEERPAHQVPITRPFTVSVTEVPQGLFEKIMGRNVSGHHEQGQQSAQVKEIDTTSLPVERVTWFDALEFCNKLSDQEKLPPYYELKFPARNQEGGITVADVKVLGGMGYRLPTEAEWEYACRAGTTTPFSFPFDYGTLGQYGWFGYDSSRPHEVGTRKPNAFGLCDMHGNVLEWCYDWFGPYAADSVLDPTGPRAGTERVARGGAYNFLVKYARSAWRGKMPPGSGNYSNTGFRVARFVSDVAVKPDADPVRQAAEWVLAVGGTLVLRREGNFVHLKQGDSLPNMPFEIYAVSLYGVQELRDEDIDRLQFLPTVTRGLNLTHNRKLGDAGFAKLAAFPGFAEIEHLEVHDTGVGETGLEQIPRFKKLTILNLSGPAVTKNVLAPLRQMDLRNVTLYECHNAGDDAMAELAALPALEQLVLSYVPISDAGLTQIETCKALRSLTLIKCELRASSLKRTPITEAGVKRLAAALPQCRIEWDGGVIEPKVIADPDRRAAEFILSFPRDFQIAVQVNDVDHWLGKASDLPEGPFRLTGVGIEWASKLHDAGLANFAGCKHVKILRLVGTQATAEGLVHFKDCQDLQELSLVGDLITDSALEIFKGRKFNSLHVQSNRVSDAGLAHFQGSHQLTKLAIEGAPITDNSLAYFKENKNLKHLSLIGTKITDAGLAHFQGCKDLETLELYWNRFSDDGLVHFKECKKLKKIDLGRLALVTDMGLANFKDCADLENLAIGGTSVGDDGLAHLKNMENLSFLRLDSTKVTDAGLVHLKACKLLGELHLWQTRVTGTGFVHLKELPNLSRLYLAECPVTDDCIGDLSECLKLRTLGLTKTRLSAVGVQRLSTALPQCQIESDHGKFGPTPVR